MIALENLLRNLYNMPKRIFIISEERDSSTSKTIDWLCFHGEQSFRLNLDDPNFNIISIRSEFVSLHNTFGHFIINKGDVVWFRRASSIKLFFFEKKEAKIEEDLRRFLVLERSSVRDSFFNWLINNCVTVGNPFLSNPCKIDVLIKAKSRNINVPDWLVTSDKKDLIPFLKKHKFVAVKNFGHFHSFDNNMTFKNLVNLITEKEIDNFKFNGVPFLFQKFIKKKYELRIFFMNDSFYSMAIFSQNDEKTKIDFRNYNADNPNRNIPYELDPKYKIKILKLMQELEIDHGSIDILVDENDNFFFLEVNPVGQFGMVSYPCNYHIEKFIARNLINLCQK